MQEEIWKILKTADSDAIKIILCQVYFEVFLKVFEFLLKLGKFCSNRSSFGTEIFENFICVWPFASLYVNAHIYVIILKTVYISVLLIDPGYTNTIIWESQIRHSLSTVIKTYQIDIHSTSVHKY